MERRQPKSLSRHARNRIRTPAHACGPVKEQHTTTKDLLPAVFHTAARLLFGARWAEEAQRVVTQFRAAHDLWAGDPAFLELLERLRGQSPEFAVWWETHDISTSEAGEKILYHPVKGLLRFEYTTSKPTTTPV
ncbi:hypothetical protein [Streptomyces sp. NPDC006463]|uniref:MmyB family transcriptional regulator n=1 Tax=Streptomyces sp. NPDC006463 TaxID=3364746 RepID=UPI0036989A89